MLYFVRLDFIIIIIIIIIIIPTESLAMNIGTIPKNMPTNFQPKRLKLKLDIVEKPENRVHKLTDSNVSRRSFAGSRSSARLVHLWARQRGGERE